MCIKLFSALVNTLLLIVIDIFGNNFKKGKKNLYKISRAKTPFFQKYIIIFRTAKFNWMG